MNNKTLIYKVTAILLFLTIDYGYALAAGPWKGKIIDIETKEPLEGAVVLAVWERVYRTPAGASSYFYEAKETLTDKEGRFEIPSYTPINLVPIISYMRGPRFTIFKPGYGSLTMVLDKYLTGATAEVYEMELSGKKYRLSTSLIELPPLKTREEKLRNISLPTSIPDDKMPKLIELMNKEAVNLGLQPSRVKGGSK